MSIQTVSNQAIKTDFDYRDINYLKWNSNLWKATVMLVFY